MSKKLKVKKTSIPRPNVSFSFKYWQNNHHKFSIKGQDKTYFITLLERLKHLSTWTVQDLLLSRSSAIRCHPIEWSDTTEKEFGIANEEQLVDTPYQIAVSANAYGRIHGFFIDNIFYIVWLDPNHLLYS